MPYQTPRALQSAISTRARTASHNHGGSPQDLIDQFYLCRLLHRVFRHNPHDWLLKGGQALLARWPEARHSRDIDLLAIQADDELDEAVNRLKAAAQLDAGDFIRFEYLSTSVERQERRTHKIKFRTYCGTKNVAIVSVDVVVGLAPLGHPVDQTLQPPFDIDLADGGLATARMWPMEDHVADKIAAMYERHTGAPSSRVKDLVDLIVIACKTTIDGQIAHSALHREVVRRTASGVDLTLPNTFTIPDRHSWEPGYRKEAARARGLEKRYRTLTGAEPLADQFISPLLTNEPPGLWDPTHHAWT